MKESKRNARCRSSLEKRQVSSRPKPSEKATRCGICASIRFSSADRRTRSGPGNRGRWREWAAPRICRIETTIIYISRIGAAGSGPIRIPPSPLSSRPDRSLARRAPAEFFPFLAIHGPPPLQNRQFRCEMSDDRFAGGSAQWQEESAIGPIIPQGASGLPTSAGERRFRPCSLRSHALYPRAR